MGLGEFSPLHILLILAIALIVIGPGKLPEVGGAIGKSIREFRKAASGDDDKPAPAPTNAAPPPAPPVAPGEASAAGTTPAPGAVVPVESPGELSAPPPSTLLAPDR